MRTYKSLCAVLLAGTTILAVSKPANAALSATALFQDIGGGKLQVTLTNTSSSDVLAPKEVLTAVLFNMGGSALSVTGGSAVLGAGSTVLFDSQPAGGDVGGEWAYAKSADISTATAGKENQGISSTGIGLFAKTDRFNTNTLSPPDEPDGLDYGITSAGDNSATGNAAVTGNNPLIQNRVVFVLTGYAGQDLAALNAGTGVAFVYGTAVGEGCIGDCGGGFVPEPAFYQSSALLGLGGLGLLRLRRRTTKEA